MRSLLFGSDVNSLGGVFGMNARTSRNPAESDTSGERAGSNRPDRNSAGGMNPSFCSQRPCSRIFGNVFPSARSLASSTLIVRYEREFVFHRTEPNAKVEKPKVFPWLGLLLFARTRNGQVLNA